MDETLQGALKERAAAYGLFARLLNREVDEKTLVELRALPVLAECLDEPEDDAITWLAVDFARLFIVRDRDARVAPYPNESVHTSKDHARMDVARDEVRAIFRAAGVRVVGSQRLGEDHVALELEFMQILAERMAQAAAIGDEEAADELLAQQAAFLDAHLLNWVPAFADIVVATARTRFYRRVARLLKEHLHEDRSFVRELLG